MALMKQAQNEAIIEGKLYEKIVRTFPDGALAGEFVIQAEITVDGENFTSLVPVSFYVKPLTLEGKKNPAYTGVKTIIDTTKAVLDFDDPATAQPDCIRLRSGQLGENMFFAKDGRFVSFTRVRGSFFDRVKSSDCMPKAQFKVKIIVANILPEERMEKGEMSETGRLIVIGNVVQYKGILDEIKFIVSNKKHIDIITKSWNVGDTVNAQGVIKYVTVEAPDEAAGQDDDFFGEPVENIVTRRVRELILTGGSGGAVDGEDEDDIAEARRARKMRIATLKEKSEEQATDAPAAAPKKTPKAQADW